MAARAEINTSVSSRDGTEITYWTSGGGPPLVLAHGAPADHTRWRPLLPYLEPYVTVHAIDRRGRGASGDHTAGTSEAPAELILRRARTRGRRARMRLLNSFGVPLGECCQMVDELGRPGCGEVESGHADVDRDRLDGVGSGDQDAGVVVNGFDYADGGVDPTEDLRGWRVDGDPDVHAPACEGRGAEHEGWVVAAG